MIIHLEVDVECVDWDDLDSWHLAGNLPIPTDRLDYLISRSHVSRCEYEFVDTLTRPPADATPLASRVRADGPVRVVCPRPGDDTTGGLSP